MPETIQDSGLWHVTLAEEDLIRQAGLKKEDFKALMAGLSKVIGYKPFCKYALGVQKGKKSASLPTYEWDKKDKNGRFKELKEKSNIADLVRV